MQAALSRRAFAPRVYRRNLTCKKTVMSGKDDPEHPENIDE